MEIWSTKLFGSDLATYVRDKYIDYLRSGKSSHDATQKILKVYSDEIANVGKDGPVVWLALAVTQWKYGRLEPKIKAKALGIIKRGGDLAAWDPKLRDRRRKVLDEVRVQLESPQPAAKPIRIVKFAKPLRKIERHWKAGQVVAFRRDTGRFVLFLTEGAILHRYVGQIPYFVLLNWEGAKIPSPERIAKLRALNYVVGVWPNRKGEPIPWECIQRLEQNRDLTGFASIDRAGIFREEGWEDCQWKELDSVLGQEIGDLPVKAAKRS